MDAPFNFKTCAHVGQADTGRRAESKEQRRSISPLLARPAGRDLFRSGVPFAGTWSGKACEGNDNRLTLKEKSDHPIVVLKPGNSGGAKGVTS